MYLYKKSFFRKVAVAFALSILVSSAIFAEDTTIIGEVDDQSQIVDTNGEVYVIANNDVGAKIVKEHAGETLKITGTIEYSEDDDLMTITARRFEVMDSEYFEGEDYGEEYEE